MIEKSKNFLIILSAPSGGGKSTILGHVLSRREDIDYSVSYTTRQPRGVEQDGVHYHFVDEDQFHQRSTEGDFLEQARVFDHWYGTSISYIRSRLDAGRHVIMDIDVQGAAQISVTEVPYIKIFIIPPSMEILRQRLVNRGTDSADEIAKRLRIARDELKYIPRYEYLVINDDLDQAINNVMDIISAEENRVTRYHNPIADFLGEPHDQ